MKVDVVRRHVRQMRVARCNLAGRRAHLLRTLREGDVFTRERMEACMKEHRRAFEDSHAQKLFRELDRKHGMKEHQVKQRQGTRFNSMLQEHYGGRTRHLAIVEGGRRGRWCFSFAPQGGDGRPEPISTDRTRHILPTGRKRYCFCSGP